MKKSIVFSLILLCVGVASVNAQEKEWDPAPFKHLSVGVGVGSAGLDFEVATTLGYHFQLRAGLSALPYTFRMPFDIGLNEMFEEATPEALRKSGIIPSEVPSEVDIFAKIGLVNGKVLVDIYPFKKAGVHLTTGLYFGNNDLISVGAQLPNEFMDAVRKVSQYDIDFGVDNKFLADGTIDLAVKTRAVKPYVGLGLSRAVPKRRISFNTDFGVLFHGAPTISSSTPELSQYVNEVLDKEGITDVLNKVVVYPVVSLRIVGRIF